MHRSGASELEKGTGSRADTSSDRNVLMEFIASKNVPLEQLARKRPFTIVKPTTTLLELVASRRICSAMSAADVGHATTRRVP